MLKTLFGSNQDSALADSIRGSMMLHYNSSIRASETTEAQDKSNEEQPT